MERQALAERGPVGTRRGAPGAGRGERTSLEHCPHRVAISGTAARDLDRYLLGTVRLRVLDCTRPWAFTH